MRRPGRGKRSLLRLWRGLGLAEVGSWEFAGFDTYLSSRTKNTHRADSRFPTSRRKTSFWTSKPQKKTLDGRTTRFALEPEEISAGWCVQGQVAQRQRAASDAACEEKDDGVAISISPYLSEARWVPGLTSRLNPRPFSLPPKEAACLSSRMGTCRCCKILPEFQVPLVESDPSTYLVPTAG